MNSPKLKHAVEVRTTKGSEIQFIMRHPITNEDFSFTLVDGRASTDDPFVLRCLLDHPLQDAAPEAGGFMLIGSKQELEKLYEEAVAKLDMSDPLSEANKKIEELKKELEGFRDKNVRAKMK